MTDAVYSCVNCAHYNRVGERGRPKPCEFRTNDCYNHRYCKNFRLLCEEGVPFLTQCRICGATFETVLKPKRLYFSTVCSPECREEAIRYCTSARAVADTMRQICSSVTHK